MNFRLTFLISTVAILGIYQNAPAQRPSYGSSLSNGEVTAFSQDPQGNLWIGTAHGLNRFNGSGYTWFLASGEDGWLSNDNISSLLWDSDGKRLWIGDECGLGYYEEGRFAKYNQWVFDPVTRILEPDDAHIIASGKAGLFRFRKEDLRVEGSYYEDGVSWVKHVLATRGGEIWVGFTRRDSTFLSILAPDLILREKLFLGMDAPVKGLCEQPSGTVWIATADDLRCRDAGSRNVLPLPQPLAKLTKDSRILFLLPYREDNLLLGIAGKGMFSYNTVSQNVTPLFPEQRLESDDYICFTDHDNNIWLSDGRSGLQFYAARQRYMSLTVSDRPERISHLCFDRQGMLWMRCGDQLQRVDPATGQVRWKDDQHTCMGILTDSDGRIAVLQDGNTLVRYATDHESPVAVSSVPLGKEAFSMMEDGTGRIWFSLQQGYMILGQDGSLTTVAPSNDPAIAFLMPYEGDLQTYAVSLRQGILRIREDGSWQRLGPERLHSISGMLRASDGSFWLGSYNRGLFHYTEKTDSLENYSIESGLIDNTIKSVIEDAEGRIWFSTSTHISRYDPKSRTFTTLHDRHFSGGQFYDLISSARDDDGKLYFGGSGYLTVIDPSDGVPEPRAIPLRIESVMAGDRLLPADSPRLRLNWKETSLEIRAAGLDFESGALLNYSWKLDGYENGWKYGSSQILAVYSYLPAGRYVFRARVRGQDGNWSPQEIALPVRIQPAPWASPWAKALYLLLGLALLVAGVWFTVRLRTQQERLAIAEQREELKQQHIDFVTNISHEFRTPLSMIYAPARQLSKMQLGQPADDLIRTIGRNAERLKELSEQILGNRPGQHREERLAIRQNDLVSIIRAIAGNFSYAATERRQTIRMDLPETMLGWFDTEKISKIFGNLLSNALKYTPEEGHIDIRLTGDGQQAVLTVSDDGPGIPEEKRAGIFNRFERLGEEKGEVIGSGIGLNYARNLALLHRGSLTFTPNEPAGSVFTLQIPVDRSSYEEKDFADLPDQPHELPDSTPDNRDLPSILVVEDTSEIRGFLRDLLRPHYRVILASDGQEALDNLKLGLPDLVLSDIIMPNLSGVGLCNAIKSDPDMAHLPVVLLTAKADAQSGAEGLRSGADAYIPKPFDPDYLLAAIESQIANRRRIQERILNLTSSTMKEPETLSGTGLNPTQRALLDKIHGLLDRHLEDESYGIAELAADMSMSYSSLYAKVKSLTGKTPQAFMTTYRMNIAMELLKSGELNVSEVSYRVGSSSPFTFSREFKKHFGFPPSQVSKKQ